MARGYFRNVLVAVDQLCNALLGGWADETWSSRCWRERRTGWIVLLDVFEDDHCRLSYESERRRLQLPPEFRSLPDA